MLLRLDRFEIPAQYMLVFHHVGLFMLSLMLDTERKRRRCWIGKLLTLKATLGLMLLLISTLFLWSVLMLNLAKIKTDLPNSTLTTPWMGLMGPTYLQLAVLSIIGQIKQKLNKEVHHSVIKSKRFSTKYRSCESLTSKKQELEVLSKLQNLQFCSTSHSTCTQRTSYSTWNQMNKSVFLDKLQKWTIG